MFDDLQDAALESELCCEAGLVTAGECRLVLLIGEFDRREAWGGGGLRSCAHWLNWRIGTSLGAAREQVRVGRALAELPLIRAAFSSGEVSYSKVRAITRVATAEMEEHFVELARHATASQLEQIVRDYRNADPDEEARRANLRERRFVTTYTDHDGMVVIRARLSPEDGAVVLAAIELARSVLADAATTEARAAAAEADGPVDVPAGTSEGDENLRSEDVPAETPQVDDDPVPVDVPAETSEVPYEARIADGLVAACASVLENGLSEETAEHKVSVIVHVDEAVLQDPSAPGCAHIEGIGAIAGHTAARLACDGAVSRMLFRHDGIVEQVGATRVIPLAMRRALITRDRGCRFPGCTSRRFIHAHHVVFASRGGVTALSNLVALCSHHHHLIHEGGFRLEMERSGTVRVFSPDGVPVPAVPRCRQVTPKWRDDRADRTSCEIDAETLAYGGGQPYDASLTIDGLLCAAGKMDY
jgi:hypothetical protein